MAVEAAQDLGVAIVVIHLNVAPDAALLGPMVDKGLKNSEALSVHALGRGVRLAVENSWGDPYAPMLDRIMAAFDEESVGFCHDSGHGNVNRAGFRGLERCGRRLHTRHLHGNLGDDAHALPYEGDVDWTRPMALLRGLDYSADLPLEVCVGNLAFKPPALFLTEA